jgi:hypothetical protein
VSEPAKYLKEGLTYPFIVIKDSVLPDGMEVWILQDISGQKILLEKKNYRQYPIHAGETIPCRVDRINCSGKIYLEPPHPVYTDEGVYEFDIVKKVENRGSGIVAVVRDIFGNELNVDISASTAAKISNNKVELKVKMLKKGIPLVVDTELDKRAVFIEKQEYVFLLEGLQELKDGVSFYVLRDSHENKHFIHAEWYQGFDIRVGQQLVCEVVKIIGGGKPVLEPVHPFYQRGKTYQMAFVSEETLPSSRDEFRNVIVISDHRGDKFYILKKHFTGKKIPRIVTCRVEKYRKGKIFFEPVNLT